MSDLPRSTALRNEVDSPLASATCVSE